MEMKRKTVRFAVVADGGDMFIGWNGKWFNRCDWATVVAPFVSEAKAKKVALRERHVMGDSVRVLRVVQ